MKMFREYSQGQMFLLPPSLDEFVPENHEARLINDVVDTMDLSPLLARYEGGGGTSLPPGHDVECNHPCLSADRYMPDNFLESLDEKEENEKRYHKSTFRYDEVRDTCICPEGKELKRCAEQRREGKPSLHLYRGESCRECALKERCTTREVRTVSRDGREPLMEAMRDKLRRGGRYTRSAHTRWSRFSGS
jgi:hypothetical protein